MSFNFLDQLGQCNIFGHYTQNMNMILSSIYDNWNRFIVFNNSSNIGEKIILVLIFNRKLPLQGDLQYLVAIYPKALPLG